MRKANRSLKTRNPIVFEYSSGQVWCLPICLLLGACRHRVTATIGRGSEQAAGWLAGGTREDGLGIHHIECSG